MSERVCIGIDGHVATVMLNRADKKNAVDHAMFDALIGAGEKLAQNPAVRAVVVHGSGNNFCAGIDLSVFQGEGVAPAGGGRLLPREHSPANFFQSAAYVWRELPVPVIAAIEGYALGAGLQIALGADIRLAAPDAQLSVMEIKWGIIPDMAISATLRDVMPVDRIKELAFTGRIVDGRAAAELGLVTRVEDDPLAAAMALATDVAARAPQAIRAIKRLVNEGWREPEAASLRLEAGLQGSLLGSPNQVEAVMANRHKKKPAFRDPGP